jgi:hypothetical protein
MALRVILGIRTSSSAYNNLIEGTAIAIRIKPGEIVQKSSKKVE